MDTLWAHLCWCKVITRTRPCSQQCSFTHVLMLRELDGRDLRQQFWRRSQTHVLLQHHLRLRSVAPDLIRPARHGVVHTGRVRWKLTRPPEATPVRSKHGAERAELIPPHDELLHVRAVLRRTEPTAVSSDVCSPERNARHGGVHALRNLYGELLEGGFDV